MKIRTILLLYFCLLTSVNAQELPVDATTNKVTYSEVVQVQGATKKSLFAKAKKWVATKNTEQNPYTISLETEQDGTIVGKGTFSLPGDRNKYVVKFAINIATKDEKCRYEFTDLVIQYKRAAGSSGGGFSYWGGSSYHEAETLEYTIETFYPTRLNGRKPAIKFYEEIRANSFEAIDREMKSIVSSFKQAISIKEDW